MGMEKFAAGAGKATWDNYKSGFFKYLERKAKEGVKRYSLVGKLRDAWMNVDWGFAAQKYRDYVGDFHGQFRIFGIQGEVPISELSTDVFLLDQPEFSRYDVKKRIISGLRLVFNDARGKKLFIWGEPGAGKTTFLKQVVQTTLDKRPENIPIFISIAEWAHTSSMNYEGLLQYIAMQFMICGFDDATLFIDYIIEEGIAILLFDGLDEIKSEIQDLTITFLNRFEKSNSQTLVTCRIDAIQSHLSGFWEVQVAHWDVPRIGDFVSKRIQNPDWQRKFMKDLDDPKRISLRDFRSNPLLLSLLCWVFDPLKGFPDNRARIYFEATRHLLVERDQEKGEIIDRDDIYTGLTLAQKEALYAQLAYVNFEKGELYFEQEKLEKQITSVLRNILGESNSLSIDGSVILPKLVTQHGILMRRGHRTYAFAHLTFQEYYTAKHIVSNTDTGMLDNLMKHVTDQRWHEVFLLTASLHDDSKSFFTSMQKNSHKILTINPYNMQIQAWAQKKALEISKNQSLSYRSFYWYLYLCFSRDPFLAHDLDRELALVFDFVDYYSYDLALGHVCTLARDIMLEIDNEKTFDKTHSFSIDPNFNNAFDFALEFAIDFIYDCLEETHPPEYEKIYLDISTVFAVIFIKVMSIFPKNTRVEDRAIAFHSFLDGWQIFANAQQFSFITPQRVSKQELVALHNIIKNRAHEILGIDPDAKLEKEQCTAISKYLNANRLFYECLQVATLEEPNTIEDMLLKAPDD